MGITIRRIGGETDLNQVLWRYMSLDKLIDLLETKTLHFSGLDSFQDPFEGYLFPEYYTTKAENLSEEESKIALQEQIRFVNANIHNVYANCWHANQYESEAMWKIFGGQSLSVAIQTTANYLFQSLGTIDITCGLVTYVSPTEGTYVLADILDYALIKRKAFSHEREFRLLLLKEDHKNSHTVQIDINKLIQSLYISPLAESWQRTAIENLVRRYGFSFATCHSELCAQNTHRVIN